MTTPFSKIIFAACALISQAQAGYGNGRIIGGSPADVGEYPSQVCLRTKGNLSGCGGTIISESWVLTAAHCLRKAEPSLIEVYANSINLDSNGTLHNVLSIKQHPGFNATDFSSEDIALIEVDPPFQFGATAQPAKLPAQDDETPGGSAAMVIGWGSTDETGTAPPSLMEVEQVTRSYQECYDIYSLDVQLTEAQLCADVPEGGKGVCGGDSGGPLIVEGVVVGVASWTASGCAVKGSPSVFTRVASYRNWITDNTSD